MTLLISGCFLLLTLGQYVLGQPPDDLCYDDFRYVQDHIYPDDWHKIVDSYDYEDLFEDTISVWELRDVDGDGRGWSDTFGGTCQKEIGVGRCSSRTSNPDNWFFTGFNSYDNAIEVIIDVTFRWTRCSPGSCAKVAVYRYDTDGPVSESQQRDPNNYTPITGNVMTSRLQQNQPTNFDTHVELCFTRPPSFNGLYLGFRDTGACRGQIKRFQVYYRIAPNITVGLLTCPEVPLIKDDINSVNCNCSPNSSAIKVEGLTRTCGPTGDCSDLTVCDCDCGFHEFRDEEGLKCVACEPGFYRTSYHPKTECTKCPLNTKEDQPHACQCECLPRHFRAKFWGPDDGCAPVPGACTELEAEIIGSAYVRLKWRGPDSDYYWYTILRSDQRNIGDFEVIVDRLDDYSEYVVLEFNDLIPATSYVFRVVVHNEVTDQDLENEHTRMCDYKLTTLEGVPGPPRIVRAYCSEIVWGPPFNPNGEIIGYDLELYDYQDPPKNNMIYLDGQNHSAYIVNMDNDLPRDVKLSDVYVKVRAKTNAEDGEWSKGRLLGCQQCMIPVRCPSGTSCSLNHTTPATCPPPTTCPTLSPTTCPPPDDCPPTTPAPSELHFSLGGVDYPNNSIFYISDIGQSDAALLCVTNRTACCGSPNRFGEWLFPNGSMVPSSGSNWDFFRGRGDRIVRLSRRNDAMSPTGVYRCKVPDASGDTQTLQTTIISRNPPAPPTSTPPTCPPTPPPPSCPPTVTCPAPPETQATISAPDPDVQCPKLQSPDNGDVDQTESSATYSCDPGYQLVGEKDRTCQSNGTWSGSEPSCVATNICQCPQIPPPPHGRVTLTGRNVGSSANCSCVDGYELVGACNRVCQENCTWSGVPSSCRVSCGLLLSPNNGSVSQTGTTFGNAATYTCDPGCTLVGDFIRICLSSGIWSGTAPICVKTCDPLPNPSNGTVSITRVGSPGIIPGSQAVYSCNRGYQIRGNSVRDCQPDGTWRGGVPVCIPDVTCDELEDPVNGTVFIYDRIAIYNCDVPYELQGEQQRICVTGEWHGVAPTCELPPLWLELNGTVYGNNSMIPASMIGINGDCLACITNKTDCCGNPNRAGDFSYPNSTAVPNRGTGYSLYRGRGEQHICLHRRGTVDSIPRDRYCCSIPDSNGVVQKLFFTMK